MISLARTLLLPAAFSITLTPGAISDRSDPWGFHAHKRINRMACFTLPPEMFPFYKRHIDVIVDLSVSPDRRRYAVEGEAPRHYIDIDHYVIEGQDPFEVVPKRWDEAVAKFGEDTLMAHGIVPWHIDRTFFQLQKAFERGDLDRIVKLSAELGHYVADAHVPLHTTVNYNGQLTDQVGIHAFWESRIPEISAEHYDHMVGRAEYIDDPLEAAWIAVRESHSAVATVLRIEKELSESFPADRKYSFESRGRGTTRNYSREFSLAYENALDGMIEQRMNASIRLVGSLWFTAWVNAGQPDLEHYSKKEVSDSLKAAMKAEMELLQEGKGHGREHE